MRRSRSYFHLQPWRRPTAAVPALRRAVLPLLALLLAPPAFAYTGGIIEWLDFPQIAVENDGHHYTGVTAIAYGWEGRVSIESEGLPRVKKWCLGPGVLSVEGLAESLDFDSYKVCKSYPAFQRPQNVHRTVGGTFPDSFVDDFAAAACNLNLELLMNQGYSRAQVLGQERTIAAEMWGDLDIDITVGDPIIEAFHQFVDITCEKKPFQPIPPGPGGMTSTGEFELVDASLSISPDTFAGDCPKELTLEMEVQGNHKGTFTARIESTEGWKSTQFVRQTNQFDPDSGLWRKVFSTPFTVPVQHASGGSGGGGGGGGIPPATGDLEALPPPGDDPFPPSSGPIGIDGGFAAQDPGSNVHQQSLRLIAKANGKTVASDYHQYRVTCDPKVAVPVATTAMLPGVGGGDDPPKPDDGDAEPRPMPGKPAPSPAPAPARPQEQRSQTRAASPAKLQAARRPSRKRAELADLLVVKARRGAGNKIEFLVENRGAAGAAASSAVLTCVRAAGGAERWKSPLPAIPAGERRWISSRPERARPVRARVRGCRIRLDPADDVAELDESNNGFACPECAASRRGRS